MSATGRFSGASWNLPRDGRAGRVAQSEPPSPDDLVASLGPECHVDLETLGLIYAPHVSAGRIPTHMDCASSWTDFLSGLIEDAEREQFERQLHEYAREKGTVTSEVLAEAGDMLSGLSRCAGVVLADKQVSRIKHIVFVSLDSIARFSLVGDDGGVEIRVLNLPEGLPQQALSKRPTISMRRFRGATLPEARERVEAELKASQFELDELTARLVRSGLAHWSGGRDDTKSLIVRGSRAFSMI